MIIQIDSRDVHGSEPTLLLPSLEPHTDECSLQCRVTNDSHAFVATVECTAINHEDTRTRALESFPQVELVVELMADDSLNLHKEVERRLCWIECHDFCCDWLADLGVEPKHELGRKASLFLLVMDTPALTCGVSGKACPDGYDAACKHVVSAFP